MSETILISREQAERVVSNQPGEDFFHNEAICPAEGRNRARVEEVSPRVGGGKYPVKRTVGEKVIVEADVFADGHDALSAVLKFRSGKDLPWMEAPMQPVANDRWSGEFVVTEIGFYSYTVEAWIDRFKSWRNGLEKKLRAGQNPTSELAIGAALIETAAAQAGAEDAQQLRKWAIELRSGLTPEKALAPDLMKLMTRYSDRRLATVYNPELMVMVEPVYARFSAWYELFPRSCGKEGHGTFRDCESQLPRIAKMGFDVVYLPPIHPIGQTFRKGRNNQPDGTSGDPGSPWGIGSAEGGHKAIHPRLGTLDDFRHLIGRARELKIEIALDIAFQCSPDHPYVKEHPEWFRKHPDGSIQYAENPPKKYQDIYPFDFECDAWRELWRELKSIFEFWIEQGVRIFRVDNPHTKAFAFWEWCISSLKQEHPELVFLAEAFTRPKVMFHLAQLGFSLSYNYFPWRNTRDELIAYFTELNRPPLNEYFRPCLWPNTPDILTEYLQNDRPVAFQVRLILAATLGASYGIYGPAFELCENAPLAPGSEEYLNSEKYEIRHWDLNATLNLSDLISEVNRIRRENPSLQFNHRLAFHKTDNDQLLAYTKSQADGSDTILTVVNLDPHHIHRGWLELDLNKFQIDPQQTYQMHDLLTGARYLWKGARNYIELNPQFAPAHIFRLRQRTRSERDFDYFM